MYRVCYIKATNKVIEMQSGGLIDRRPKKENETEEEYQKYLSDCDDLEAMRLNSLKQNAINAGYQEADIDVKWMTEEEYQAQIELGITKVEWLEIKNKEVNQVREKKIAEGIPYDFPDGKGTIQTRDMVDIRNILTNVITATVLSIRGVKDPVMVFRDMEDVEHKMTPDQMLDMGLASGAYGQAIVQKSWDLKKESATLTADQIASFDVEKEWLS